MVMRWNKEEEGKRRCVDVGVVIVGVGGVVLVVISVASLSRSCGEALSRRWAGSWACPEGRRL